tara:strand:- start:2070 stop:3020 length:951 start_codon:yes stop_codon:yes gene_type:complete
MLSESNKKILARQGYKVVGNHSAAKTCFWCKKALRGEGVCYKDNFYGIQSNRCVQMSPALESCNLRCLWCWRAVEYTKAEWKGPVDNPKEIVAGCIEAQKKLLSGFGGYEKVNKKRLQESKEPSNFAVSLIGEPTLYPKLPQLINEINSRGMTSFLVSNGTRPDMIKKLLNHQPTQIYVTLPAPNEKIFQKCCRPLTKDTWQKIQQSLSLLSKFNRSVVRLTLVKNLNMVNPADYAEILSKTASDFVELKAYMYLGLSRKRLKEENMPLHPEVKEFAEKINKHLGYTVAGESAPSRVVLLSSGKKDLKIDSNDKRK